MDPHPYLDTVLGVPLFGFSLFVVLVQALEF